MRIHRREGAKLSEGVAVGAAVLCLVLSACGGDDAYPEEVVDNFVSACTSQPGTTVEYCRCSIREIQNDVSIEEFRRLEQGIAGGNGLPDRLVDAISECIDLLR